MIETLINADNVEYERMMEADYVESKRYQKYVLYRWYSDAKWRARFAVLFLICKVRGHQLVDDGHAGPESGYMDVNCKRCSWHAGREWLY